MGLKVVATAAWALAVATFVPATALGQPERPSLTPERMNCGDTKTTDDSRLTRPEARHIARSLAQVWKARARRSDWTHAPNLDAYTFAFCGTNYRGHHVIIVDGVYGVLGAAVCDDTASFGVVYDPRTRRFGDIVFAVSSCVPSSSRAQGVDR